MNKKEIAVKLRELARDMVKGSEYRPQVTGVYFGPARNGFDMGSCALGAAHEGRYGKVEGATEDDFKGAFNACVTEFEWLKTIVLNTSDRNLAEFDVKEFDSTRFTYPQHLWSIITKMSDGGNLVKYSREDVARKIVNLARFFESENGNEYIENPPLI